MSRILLVEDEGHLAEGLAFNLRNSGYDVDCFELGGEALASVADVSYDLVLLDLMLPDMDGLEICQRLRQDGFHMPILMISARDRSADTIAGLDAGADDYITKPFDLHEVLARIRGALRRQVWSRKGAPADGDESLAYGAWNIDLKRYLATGPKDREIRLSPKERDILKLFAERPQEVISREAFLESVWGIAAPIETRTVDNFIRRLRQNFEERPSEPRHIVSVRGAGYRFDP